MRCLMDECTHMANYSAPLDRELVDIVTAEYDAYQPRGAAEVRSLESCYPGCRVTAISEGHVRAYLLYQHVYRVIDKMVSKYGEKIASASVVQQ